MTLRLPLWLVLAALVSCFGLGALSAQGPEEKKPGTPAPGEKPEVSASEYPYLPDRYGEAYIPSIADWQALRLTALGASTTRITEQFNRQHLTCFPSRKGLALTLDLAPLPTWKLYAGGGKFSAPAEKVRPELEKAVEATMRFVRSFFSEVRDEDVSMRIYIHSENVGKWEGGKLTLAG
jgi:hypothetical protein